MRNNSYEITIKLITKKMKQLFKLKSRNPHRACVIYEAVCVFKQKYIGETRRNVELGWEEHENISKDCEPSKRLKDNLSHKFSWKILFTVPKIKRIRKILEASAIALKILSLNKQTGSKKAMLYCSGVT